MAKIHLPKVPKFVSSIAVTGFFILSLITAVSVTANINVLQLLSPKAVDYTIPSVDPKTGNVTFTNPNQTTYTATAHKNSSGEITSYTAPAQSVSGNGGSVQIAEPTSGVTCTGGQHLCSCNAGSGCTNALCDTYCGGSSNIVGSIASTNCANTTGCTYDQVVNAINATPNTTGYDCKKAPNGQCGSEAGDVSGYYSVGTGPDAKYYAIGGTGNDPSTYSVTSLATQNACKAAVAAGQGNYQCGTAGGLQEFSITQPQEQAQQQIQLVAQCKAAVAAGQGNYNCSTPGGLQEFSITQPQQQAQEKIACLAAVAAGQGNYDCNTPGGLQEYSITEPQQQAQEKTSCQQFVSTNHANLDCNIASNLSAYQDYQNRMNDPEFQSVVKSCKAAAALGKANSADCYSTAGIGEYLALNQVYLAPATGTQGGYYMSCQNVATANHCPSGTQTSYGGGCACFVTAANPGPVTPVIPSTITISTPRESDCNTAAGGKYLAYMSGKCIISTAPLDQTAATSAQFNALATTTSTLTASQCSSIQKSGDANTSFSNGNCTISPITTVPAAPIATAPVVYQNSDCTSTCTSAGYSGYSGRVTGSSCTCSSSSSPAVNASLPPGTVVEPTTATGAPSTAGNYYQRDPSIANFQLPNGKTIETGGCGAVAVANIVDGNPNKPANLTPQDIVGMIRPEDWKAGISGGTGGDFMLLLTGTSSKPYSSSNPGFGYTYKFVNDNNNASVAWKRMGSNDVLWIGTDNASGAAGSGIAHITYLTPTDTPNTFNLQTNDYFGKGMKCSPNGSGSGFDCKNPDTNEKASYETKDQAVYILTPPSQ